MNKEIFKKRLLELMKEKNMSQGKLALYTDLTTGAICRYLKGERTPSLNSLVKISYILKINPDYLSGTTNDKEIPKDLREQYAIACKETEDIASDINNLKSILGVRIRILMDDKNMKQKDLAKLLNIRPSAISRYISGKREPSLAALI